MITSKQLEARKLGLAASEFAAAIDMNPYDDCLTLYGKKIGEIPDDDLSDNTAVLLGTELENVIGRVFAKITGKKIRRNNRTIYHPVHKWAMCHLDFEIVYDLDNLECKTCSLYTADQFGPTVDIYNIPEDYTPILPDHYMIQCQIGLACTGRQTCYLCLLLLHTREFRIYVIRRDDDFIKGLLQLGSEFMRCVRDRVPPTPDYTNPNISDALKKIYKDTDGTVVILEDEVLQAHHDLVKAKEEAKVVLATCEAAKNAIKFAMGSSTFGMVPGGKYVRAVERNPGYIVEAFDKHVLRFSKDSGRRKKK